MSVLSIWNEIVRIIFNCYVSLIRAIYFVINVFIKKRVVRAPKDSLLYISATQAAQRIRKGMLKSTDLIEAYIKRIREVNPLLNAMIIDCFDEALEKARHIDMQIELLSESERDEFFSSRPLLGVPYTVKNNIPVKGKLNTNGFWYFRNRIAEEDAKIIKLMDSAGAILIGITNVPEMCAWLETNNSVFGKTNNPYDTRKTCGGSSGGEASLIGAAGSLIGIGTDLCGSVRQPCNLQGIFGLKTSPHHITAEGISPAKEGYQSVMSVFGPMCRYSEDLPLLYRVLTENKFVDDGSFMMKKARFYIMPQLEVWGFEKTSRQMEHAVKRAAEFLESYTGHDVTNVSFPKMSDSRDIFLASWQIAPKTELDLIVERVKGKINIPNEMYHTFTGRQRHPYASFGILAASSKAKRMSEEYKTECRQKREVLIEEVLSLLEENSFILMAGWPSSATYHHQAIFVPNNMFHYQGIWNVLGLPGIACPAGFDSDGMPLGVQIIGRPDSDYQLMRIAKVMEENFHSWDSPDC